MATQLWKIYIRKQKTLERSGRLAWGQDKTQPTAQSLQEQLKAMTVYGHIQQVLDKAHRIQQKGNLPRAIASYQKAMKLSASLKKIDRWHYQKKLSLNPHQIHTRWKRLKAARKLQHRGNKLLARAAFVQAQEVRQQMLQQLSLSPARTSWKERIAREQQRAERAQKILVRGHKSFRRRRWKSARRLYQVFLKQFPQASQRKRLQQKIKTCSCGIGGVPWLDCSREKAYIRRISKGRR